MVQKSSFSMRIDDVFYRYGIFVTGKIQCGCIKIFDKLMVIGENEEMENLCISLSKHHPYDKTQKTSVKEAVAGDYVSICLLQGSKLQIRKGMMLTARE